MEWFYKISTAFLCIYMNGKVSVIGAGLVGLCLAKDLAERGVEVDVFDSKGDVSDGAAKASGIFSASGMDRIGIDPGESMLNTLDGAILHAGGERLRVKSGRTMAYVADRGMLAEICKRDAEGAGARINLGRRIGRDELLALADDGNILIGADGAVSTVASTFHFPEMREYVLTYKAEYSNASPEDENSVGLFFSNSMAYRFFGWYCPYSNGRLEVGIGTSGLARVSGSAAFSMLTESGMLGGVLDGAKKINGYASIIPLRSRKQTAKGNVALVGDAAGQVKATTGGGIIFGCSCAHALAETIANGKPLSEYDKAWRRMYGADLMMHRMLHEYYSGIGARSLGTLIRIMKALGAESFFGAYGDMDRPSLMLKRFFLRGLLE